jgi:hypothetical protein
MNTMSKEKLFKNTNSHCCHSIYNRMLTKENDFARSRCCGRSTRNAHFKMDWRFFALTQMTLAIVSEHHQALNLETC